MITEHDHRGRAALRLDRSVEVAFHLVARLPALDPIALGLARARSTAAERIAAETRARLAPLLTAVTELDPAACARFDSEVAAALDALRQDTPAGLRGALARADRRFYRNEEEWLDDPSFPQAQRVHLLAVLDRFNEHLGNYRAWTQAIADFLDEIDAPSPARVCDLAAGHGGFAIALKERLGARVEVLATDYVEEYLDLGRDNARRRGVAVTFQQQDATDLRCLPPSDLLLCTQSLHHFPPGMVARMIGQAARATRHALCFIDAERNPLGVAVLGPLMALYGRSRVVVHDTVASLRRMYMAEELQLLALLAPGVPPGFRLHTERRGPGYAYLFGRRT